MSVLEGSTLLTAAELSRAAYNNYPNLTLNYNPSLKDSVLGENGLLNWTALTQTSPEMDSLPEPFANLPKSQTQTTYLPDGNPIPIITKTSGINDQGYYVSGNDAAFVAKSTDGTLALVFRGSEGINDFADAAFSAANSYKNFAPLISAFIAYANEPTNGINNVLIVGHSLGGELATLFATDRIDGAQNITSLDPLKFPLSKISVVTFGSPGIADSDHTLVGFESTILNISQTGDPVYYHLGPVAPLELLHFEHPGPGYPGPSSGFAIDLPDVANGFFTGPVPAEHKLERYTDSIFAITQSPLFKGTHENTQYRIYFSTTLEWVPDTSADSENFVLGTSFGDTIVGGAGRDLLDGDIGKDRLIGNGGPDMLRGGRGDDTFVFNHDSVVSANLGTVSTIIDYDQSNSSDRTYSPNENDLIDLSEIGFNTLSGHATTAHVRAIENSEHKFSILQINTSGGGDRHGLDHNRQT